MKMMKLALLGTAALAVSAMGAQADDLSALKAEIEALNARVAQLETAPAVPAGYSLMTVSDIEPMSLTGEYAKDRVGYSGTNRISVMPTADAPAAAVLDWDFQIRAAIAYIDRDRDRLDEDDDFDSDDGEFQVLTRARMRARASMDTAVGAVGVDFRFQGNSEFGGGADVVLNIAWGWWQMTPELQFGAGYTGSLGNVPYGQDENITGIGTTVFFNPGDQEQMRLTWTSGPLTLAAAIEDSGGDALDDEGTGFTAIDDPHPSIPAFAARATYAGDTLSAGISAFWDDPDDAWQIGAGATAALGDMATISVAAAIGDDTSRKEGEDDDFVGDFGDFWGASIYGRLDVTEQTYVEASYGYLDGETILPPESDFTRQAFDVGIYHSPVDQLVFGLEANYLMLDFDNDAERRDTDVLTVAFISWFNL